MLTYETINKQRQQGLTALFSELIRNGDEHFFHPHPLTSKEAEKRVRYKGLDIYFLQISAGEISGYGFLRGWDEGYNIPSLGIVIHPKFRGQNLGKDFVHFLHAQAKERKVTAIRLTVDIKNKIATTLYKEIGYQFKHKNETTLEGFFEVEN